MEDAITKLDGLEQIDFYNHFPNSTVNDTIFGGDSTGIFYGYWEKDNPSYKFQIDADIKLSDIVGKISTDHPRYRCIIMVISCREFGRDVFIPVLKSRFAAIDPFRGLINHILLTVNDNESKKIQIMQILRGIPREQLEHNLDENIIEEMAEVFTLYSRIDDIEINDFIHKFLVLEVHANSPRGMSIRTPRQKPITLMNRVYIVNNLMAIFHTLPKHTRNKDLRRLLLNETKIKILCDKYFSSNVALLLIKPLITCGHEILYQYKDMRIFKVDNPYLENLSKCISTKITPEIIDKMNKNFGRRGGMKTRKGTTRKGTTRKGTTRKLNKRF
jgi:hypothetical protein